MQKEDRRVFQRFPTNLSVRVLDSQSNKWALVETKDISAKGIGISTEKEIAPFTALEMWLPIAQTGECYYTKGMVVWSKMLEPEKYRAGINLKKADFMGMSQILRNI